jgi:beta-phosphoglucomutase
LFELFDVIITSEDTKNGKPAPDPYLMAIEKCGISKDNCYVVENGPLGIESAVNSGLTCLAVRGNSPLPESALKKAGATLVYRNISELRKHLIWVDTNIRLTEFHKIFESVWP